MKPTVRTPRKHIIDQKAKNPGGAQRDRPGKQERHFQVEDDEQDGDQIEGAHRTSCGNRQRAGKAALIGMTVSRRSGLDGAMTRGTTSNTLLRTSANPMKIRIGRYSSSSCSIHIPRRPDPAPMRFSGRTMFISRAQYRQAKSARNAGLAEDSPSQNRKMAAVVKVWAQKAKCRRWRCQHSLIFANHS